MGFQPAGLANRDDAQEKHGHLEARIEKLERRIVELESENERLRSKLGPESRTISRYLNTLPNSY
jgi:hypothetical protein